MRRAPPALLAACLALLCVSCACAAPFCGPAFAIPDLATSNATVTVAAGAGAFASLDITLQHTSLVDLLVHLTDPSGSVTYLFASVGVATGVNASWSFNDSATQTLAAAGGCTGVPPNTGPY